MVAFTLFGRYVIVYTGAGDVDLVGNAIFGCVSFDRNQYDGENGTAPRIVVVTVVVIVVVVGDEFAKQKTESEGKW